MGDPRLYYDSERIDIGNILEEFSLRHHAYKSVSISIGNAIQSQLWTGGVRGTIKFRTTDIVLYHKLKTFWGWAIRGHPFSVALDSAKNYLHHLDASGPDNNYLKNADLEEWELSGSYNLIDWTTTETGGVYTDISRATNREKVQSGGSAAQYYNDGTNVGSIAQTCAVAFPASTAGQISIWVRAESDTAIHGFATLQNTVTTNYLRQDGSWGATQNLLLNTHFYDDDDVAFGDGKAYYRRAHLNFTSEGTAGALKLTVSNITGSGSYYFWIDNLKLKGRSGKIPLASTHKIAANDYIWLQSRNGWGELKQVSSITAGDYIVCTEPIQQDYNAGDHIRHRDFFRLIAHEKQVAEPAYLENEAVYQFELDVQEYVPAGA